MKAQAAGTELTLDGLSQVYGAARAVDNVTLEIKAGELVALLGPSGCGKTTLLRIIAGFIRQTEGRVVVGGAVIDHLPPNKRTVGIVFQNYALFPHMTVAENVAYGLAARGASRADQASRTREMLELVQLAHLSDRLPRQMSGGQQQRVALARALAVRPSILLLDEPFAALDKNLRLDMQIEVKRIQRLAGTTTILVTHDQEEAMSMADRVAVLNQGRLEQFAPPTELYDRPSSLFVNTFVGSANVLKGRLDLTDQATIALDAGGALDAAPTPRLPDGARVVACVRPEQLQIVEDGTGLAGIVEMSLPLGATMLHEIRLADGSAVKVAEPRGLGAMPRVAGTPVRVRPSAPEAITIFAQS